MPPNVGRTEACQSSYGSSGNSASADGEWVSASQPVEFVREATNCPRETHGETHMPYYKVTGDFIGAVVTKYIEGDSAAEAEEEFIGSDWTPDEIKIEQCADDDNDARHRANERT
jgi:hypothetical protein